MGLFQRKRPQSALEKALSRKELAVVKDYLSGWAKKSGEAEAREAVEKLDQEGILTEQAMIHLRAGLMVQLSGRMSNPSLARLGGPAAITALTARLNELENAAQGQENA